MFRYCASAERCILLLVSAEAQAETVDQDVDAKPFRSTIGDVEGDTAAETVASDHGGRLVKHSNKLDDIFCVRFDDDVVW